MSDIFLNGMLAMIVGTLVWCLYMGNKKVKNQN